jgi:pimeloyl-ACP methyl ester carboxylesterase
MDDRTETLPGPPPCVVHHRHAVVNGVRLHYAEAMPQPATVKGREMLCLALHGFPEFWFSWHHQIPVLAAAGFRVLAPDLRGYNESGRPRGVRNYRIRVLVEDVAGLIAHAGASRAVVVGHDWGGGLAWATALRRPDLVERLIVLNAPHPAAFRRELKTPGQLLRSWYMFFFQLPWLPERLLRAGDYRLIERSLRREPVRAGAFSDEDIRRYKQALAQPGAATAAINYYRALFRHAGDLMAATPPIRVPTLLIWGRHDRYLGVRLTEGLERWVPGIRVERLEASHWVQNDASEEVNRLMLGFLADLPARRQGCAS